MTAHPRHPLVKKLARLKWQIETLFNLALARFLIRFIPFRYWKGTLGTIAHSEPSGEVAAPESKARARALAVSYWVRLMAGRVPFETLCLPQAMAARWMLARRGVKTQVFMGAKRDGETGDAKFHAWLMHGDECLTGHAERETFSTFGTGPKSGVPG